MLFDTHAHLNDKKLAQPEVLKDILARAKDAKVFDIATVGYDWPSSLYAVRLAEKYDCIHALVGIHPHSATDLNDDILERLKALAVEDKVVAIGEIGLDYYRNLSPKDVQISAFEKQIDLAKELKMPIAIHDRDAHGDVLEIIKRKKAGEYGGIFHCYSGSWEMAKVCMDENFHISIAGPITFKNARKLPEVAAKTPLERLLIETDCPYLTPEPHRGKINEPANVYYVAEKIAQIRNISFEEIAAATTANARKVYNLD